MSAMADVSRKRQTTNAPGFGANTHIQDEGVARALAQMQSAIEDLYGKFEALTATATEEVAGYDDSDVRKRLGNTGKTLDDHLASIKALERAFPIIHAQVESETDTYYIARRYNPVTTHLGGYVRVAKPIAAPVIRMTRSETGLYDDNDALILWEEVGGGTVSWVVANNLAHLDATEAEDGTLGRTLNIERSDGIQVSAVRLNGVWNVFSHLVGAHS